MVFFRCLVICWALAGVPAYANNVLTGLVVAVADGDTITVLDAERQRHRIRLAGIDAPELAQAFGDRSKTRLSHLLFNQNVRVEWNKRDRDRMIVGKVWVQPADCPNCQPTRDAGLEQVTVGMAWWYRAEAREQSEEDRRRYEQAEFEAKIGRAGLWNDKNPVAPWAWRRR